jgi:hypothetical protein
LSVFDGLNVLEHAKKLPKNLYVETNVILHGPDKDFSAFLFSPVMFHARALLPSLREEKQPVGIVGSLLVASARLGKKPKPPAQSENGVEAGAPPNNELFAKVLELQIQGNARPPEQSLVDGRFAELRTHVRNLEERGVHVVFFEMPVNESLCELPWVTTIRASFLKYFPEDKYTYIPMPPCADYHTTDGVHLSQEEGARYTHYFKEMRNSLRKG